MVQVKKWIYASDFNGQPKLENFKLVTEEIADSLQDGEVLCEAVFLSVDPYMRLFKVPVGEQMIGEQVAKAAAHIGLFDKLQPASGETVLVTAAAGAVGSIVGQIAKIKGCKVIGFAGTKEKCDWLKNDLGFDAVFNYKECDVVESICQVDTEGVDCFFDNVGGDFASKVIANMKFNGRVVTCGQMDTYRHDEQQPSGPYPFRDIMMKNVTVKGLLSLTCKHLWPAALAEIQAWIKEGKMKYRETVTEGFDNMPTAFIGLFQGSNIGKAVVKV